MTDHLQELPDNARLWIFSIATPLDSQQETLLANDLRTVIATWKAHGAAVAGGFAIRYQRFLLAAADEAVTHVSGCSIDSLVRGIRSAVANAKLSLADDNDIFFRSDSGNVEQIDRDRFRDLIAQGKVTPLTTVFNNTVLTVGDLRRGRWECAAKDSWHARAFKFPANQRSSAAQ